jgi:hypothetical protein
LLWIDGVCINQTDILERNRQVQLMGEIYSRASCVLIWLGDVGISPNEGYSTAPPAVLETFAWLSEVAASMHRIAGGESHDCLRSLGNQVNPPGECAHPLSLPRWLFLTKSTDLLCITVFDQCMALLPWFKRF